MTSRRAATTPTLVGLVWLAGCGPAPEVATSAEPAGSTGHSGSGSLEPPPDLPPEQPPCGNGVLDPGEECDDARSGCDACTDTCELPVEPALEWSVALAPMLEVRAVALTQAGRFYVFGEAAGEAALLHTVEASGVTHTVDFAGLGMARVFDLDVNGAATDGAEVAVLGLDAENSIMVARFGAEGLIADIVPIDLDLSDPDVAVTSAGITIVDYYESWRVSPTGVVAGPFASFGADWIMAFSDRLFFSNDWKMVVTGPDGGEPVEIPCPGELLTVGGTHSVWGAGDLDGVAVMGSCELAVGEPVSAVVASGEGGLEVIPRVTVVGAGANGHPIGEWSVCPGGQGSAAGCRVPRERGFGGPGDPVALELDACDIGSAAVVAPDGKLYMVRRDRETGAPSLVWRWTLPDRPPWG